jgi:hypothetical protein
MLYTNDVLERDPRWRLESRSRQCELHKSKILLDRKKNHQKESKL